MKVYELTHRYDGENDTLGMYSSLEKAKAIAKRADKWNYMPCVNVWTANDTEMTDINAYYVILEWEVE